MEFWAVLCYCERKRQPEIHREGEGDEQKQLECHGMCAETLSCGGAFLGGIPSDGR